MNMDLGTSFEDVYHPQFPMQGHDLNMNIGQRSYPCESNGLSPQVLLNALSLVQQQVTQLQSLVQAEQQPHHSWSEQQAAARSAQSIISQLIAASVNMLPLSPQPIFNSSGVNGLSEQLQLDHLVGDGQGWAMNDSNAFNFAENGSWLSQNIALQSHKPLSETDHSKVSGVAQLGDVLVSQAIGDNTGLKNVEQEGEATGVSSPSYKLIEMNAKEILAEHTHFCGICNRGFKRNANMRMHMRAHGEDYKTPAALVGRDSGPSHQRRFSCPSLGCKRNKEHKNFQALKTMLCVKNHYRRSHCPKMHTCSKCKIKKFAVVADLRTHEKHCGKDKLQCSCGTRFSRKDKLFGHFAIFPGHTPAFASAETERSAPERIGNK